MKERVILHCDLNNFFASVSLLYQPTLYGVPVAVSGSIENRHGIILAKNELAKACGIKTAEAVWEAKTKCPQLVLIKAMYREYQQFSKAAQEIYSRYTDIIEPFGIDECWLDVSGSTLLFGSGEQIAECIRREIKAELGITVSVGVSFNKVFAKLGSDMKKPDAVTAITRENFKQKVWPLSTDSLLFIGKSTAKKLKSLGILTIGEISLCSDEVLSRLLGKAGPHLRRCALGEENSPVVTPTAQDKPKSVGRSVTSAADFTNYEQVWQTFLTLSEDISATLHRHALYAGGVQIHTRTDKLTVKEFSHMIEYPTNSALILARKGYELFCKNCRFAEPLRSVGLRAVHLKGEVIAVQQDLFGECKEERRLESIEDSLYTLRGRFGKKSIVRGRTI